MDEVAVLDASRVSDTFVEVEVELRDGNPAELDAIADELVSAGAEPGNGLPKVFRALGREERLGSSPRPFEELRSRLREQLREIERHDPGTRSAAIPRASTTCASPSAVCGRCSGPGRSSSLPTPPSSRNS